MTNRHRLARAPSSVGKSQLAFDDRDDAAADSDVGRVSLVQVQANPNGAWSAHPLALQADDLNRSIRARTLARSSESSSFLDGSSCSKRSTSSSRSRLV